MYKAGRSFTEPVGLFCSSFAHSRTSGDGDSRGNPTSGVLPTESTRLSNRMGRGMSLSLAGRVPGGPQDWCARRETGSAAGDRGEDGHRRVVRDRGVEAAVEAHVLVVDVDVHEAVELPLVVDQPGPEALMPGVDVLQDGVERVTRRLHGLRPTSVGTEDRRHLYLHSHSAILQHDRSSGDFHRLLCNDAVDDPEATELRVARVSL